jgi:cytochrome c553
VSRRRFAPAQLLLAAILCLWSAAALAEDAIGGDMIVTKDMKPWEGCGECHDLDGVAPNGHFPNLAGQKPDYFLKQMEDFRLGKRSNDHGQMGVASRATTGKTLDAVAAYFAALPSPPPQPAKDLDAAGTARAQALLAHGSRADRLPACANCHALKPKHDFIAPCLESQQAGYLEKQLNDFKAGRRRNDPQATMQKIAQRLPQPDIAVLSQYLASLERPAPGTACAGEQR